MQNVSILHHKLGNLLIQALAFLDLRNFTTFIWMVIAVVLSQNVCQTAWDVVLPFNVYAASTQARFRRWLHNSKVDASKIYEILIRHALQNWTSRITLALDTSMLRDKFCMISVCVIYMGRAIPIAWKILEHNSSSVKFKDYNDVLEQARTCLSQKVEVLFLADRGFVSQKLMKQLNEWGWNWHIRLKGNQVLHCQGKRITPKTLFLQKGNALLFNRVIDFGQGLCKLSLSAGWSRDSEEAWYILSNGTASTEVFMEYALRFDIEEAFRDEKSGGFNLEKSRLEDVKALDRLLLILAVATIVIVNEGWEVASSEEKRKEVDAHWCRGLSYFQIGWRWLLKQLGKAVMELKCHIEVSMGKNPLPVAPTRKESIRRRKRKDPKWHFKKVVQYSALPE